MRHRSVLLLTLALLAAPALTSAAIVPIAVGPGNTFSPKTPTINVGDTVRWTLMGGSHNVNSDTGLFRSGNVSTSWGPFEFTFNSAGTFGYHCEAHGARRVCDVRHDHGRRRRWRHSRLPAVQHRQHLGQRERRHEDDHRDAHRRRRRPGLGQLRDGRRQRDLPRRLHPDQRYPQLGRQRRRQQDLRRADRQRQRRGAEPVVHHPAPEPGRRRDRSAATTSSP